MNSRPENKPNQQTLEKMAQMEKGLMEAAAYINQLSRILFLTVQAAGGKVTINEAKIDPTWRLDKSRMESGELCLTSSITPPPTEEQLTTLIQKLRGTRLTIEEVQAECGLESWPPAYLSFQISHKMAIMNGIWIDAEIARQAHNQGDRN